MIRTATPSDVPRIQQIISSHAELGKMLFKNYAQLYEDLRDFAVYVGASSRDVRLDRTGSQSKGSQVLRVLMESFRKVAAQCF